MKTSALGQDGAAAASISLTHPADSPPSSGRRANRHPLGAGGVRRLARTRCQSSRSEKLSRFPVFTVRVAAAVAEDFTMRMIESVDSVVTRSSEDLWAEICSCLPHPDQKDASDAFTDSFMDSYADGGSQGSGSNGSSQADLKPWAPLNDSEVYLASLERRLMRIKGLSQEVTSKDMLRTLAQAKKECWDRFLQEKFESEFYVEGHDSDESTLEHLKRWLQPDKVAISTEEVQYLIPPESQPEKQETEGDPPAAEQ